MKLTKKKLEQLIMEEITSSCSEETDAETMEESTEQQKKQQKKDNWDTRDRITKRTKVKISKAQNKGESEFKREPIEFDPIHGLGKAMKDRYDDLEVYANGKEVEE